MPSNSKTWLERVSKDKPSSLLGFVISDEGKKFYNIDNWCQSYKTFFFVTDEQANAFYAYRNICWQGLKPILHGSAWKVLIRAGSGLTHKY